MRKTASVYLDRLTAACKPPGANFVDCLRHRAQQFANSSAFIFWDGEQNESHVSNAELDSQARAIAAELVARGWAGERALLMYPPGLDFVAALFGCFYAGVVAVPAYPPRRSRNSQRVQSICRDAHAAIVLSTDDTFDRWQSMNSQISESQTSDLKQMSWIATDRIRLELAQRWSPPSITDDTLAVLQYTSGSTGNPKGVMLTHGNLTSNCAVIAYSSQPCKALDVGLTWLPVYHDMGLVGGILEPMYRGTTNVLMPPLAFLQKPVRWLRGITRFRASVSAGPNFAFALCADKISLDECRGLDLSCWELAFNGSEPVRVETLEAFTKKFAPYGFRPQTHYPCYGMAESTLFITGGVRDDLPIIRSYSARDLEEHRAVAVEPSSDNTRRLVSCGHIPPDVDLVIVDQETCEPLNPGLVGEIWISCSSVAQGYWNRPEETKHSFGAVLRGRAGTFLRTGDLGFVDGQELFLTGRCKDLIIIRGRNIYPHDVELTAERAHPALRLGGGACFSVDVGGEERLVVVQEVDRQSDTAESQQLIDAVCQAVLEEHEAPLSHVILLKPGKLPKTSSGKVQRSECRAAFLSGELEVLAQWKNPTLDTVENLSVEPAVEPPSALHSSEAIRRWLVSRLACRLHRDANKIDIHEPFVRFGLDSLALVELSGELERLLGRPVSPTVLYGFPTIAALADHLADTNTNSFTPARQSAGTSEPIAVVGMACRFPGADSPEAFWQLLREGRDATGEIPSRWDVAALYDPDPAVTGKMYTRRGGYLKDIDQFDAQFFGIPPREAIGLDPQQRLLLEVAWEAVENAGSPADRIAGSSMGIFVGIGNCDYARLQGADNLDAINAYSGTGTASSIAAGRLAYLFGTHGPCLAIDTACSSSLVAIHLAVQSLRSGECRSALAGGVNLVLDPSSTVALCRMQALSRDGRCKTFDESADGYGRGEGCGLVMLKRLSDAVADGDRIWAVIRGSAINHDGRSNGLTAPHGPSQESLLLAALENAGVQSSDISYLEAHGTGTSLGDPIEIEAAASVLGKDRPLDQPLLVGSVKTNIGHLETAAGVAGLIKVILALGHGEIPPHLNFQQPNAHIPWERIPIRVPTQLCNWSSQNRRRIAGVSSFGFSGTNVHVVLEEALEPRPTESNRDRPLHVLPLSAKDEVALRELAERFAKDLAARPDDFGDVCYTAAVGREHFPHRLAVVASTNIEAAEKLAQARRAIHSSGICEGRTDNRPPPKIAFLFTGQGSQYVGMARGLYETHSLFRQSLDRCDEILRDYLPQRLLAVLHDGEDASSLLHQTSFAQPALFSIEYALCELWRSWGVEPQWLVGHSVGEYVAALTAGVFSLEDGLKLISARGRLMQATPAIGAMVAVAADETAVRSHLHHFNGKIDIAAVNSPRQTVVSGPATELDAVIETLEAAGLRTAPLRVSHAFHSSLLEPMLDEFESICRQVDFAMPDRPIASNLYGRLVTGEMARPEYWRQHVRKTVRFSDGIVAIDAAGANVFVEIGPKPILIAAGRQSVEDRGQLWLSSLRPGCHDWAQMLESMAELYVRGVPLDWHAFDRDYPRRKARIPTYPFQRSRYWIEERTPTTASCATDRHEPANAPPSTIDEWLFEVQWQPRSRPAQPLVRRPADFLLSPSQIRQLVQPEINRVQAQIHLPRYRELSAALDDLSAAYIEKALRRMGWSPTRDIAITVDELADRLKVLPTRRRLFNRLWDVLAEDWIRHLSDHKSQFDAMWPAADVESKLAALKERYPECDAELTLIESCGSHLPEVLRGDVDPLQLLFPNGSTEWLEKLYRHSPFAKPLNALLQETVFKAIESLPSHRPLKILELGAGTGGTAAQLLPGLPADRTEYWFTDVSRVFTHAAQEKFGRFPFVRYGELDVESDAQLQDYAAGQFDLIIAANVLHALRDLRDALRSIRSLLSDRGELVLLEGVRPQRWLDLIFGLTDGWWRFADTDIRPNHVLASRDSWLRILHECDFSETEIFPDSAKDNEISSPQAVLVARAGGESPKADIEDLKPVLAEDGTFWLILADEQGVGPSLAKQLRERDADYALVSLAPEYACGADRTYRIAHIQDLSRVLAARGVKQHEKKICIVHLFSLDSPTTDELTAESLELAHERGCGSAIEVVQWMQSQPERAESRLWLVTRGAQSVGEDKSVPGLAHSPMWGLGRVLVEEHESLWGGLIDLDPSSRPEESAAVLCDELLSPDGEDHVAYRRDNRFAARLVHRSRTTDERQEIRWRDDGSYVITGGLGDIGMQIARWMVEQGARQLVLVGRTPLPNRSQWDEIARGNKRESVQVREIQALESLGAKIRVESLDVSNKLAVESMVDRLNSDGWPPVRGVVHAAGVPDAQPLSHITSAQLAEILRPKVAGAWVIHEVFRRERLDFFVCFSSAAATLGRALLGSYAAANMFLAALAHQRRAENLPALTINWGYWEQSANVSPKLADIKSGIMPEGTRLLTTQQGLAALQYLLERSDVNPTVMPVDIDIWSRTHPLASQSAFLSNVRPRTPQTVAKKDVAQETTSPRDVLLAADPEQRLGLAEDYLRQQISRVMRLPPEKLDSVQSLNNLGVDSLMAVELRNHVQSQLGVTIPLAQLLQDPTIPQLAQGILEQLATTNGVSSSRPTVTSSKTTSTDPTSLAIPARLEIAEKPTDSVSQPTPAQLDEMSDEQVDAMLRQLLREEHAQT